MTSRASTSVIPRRTRRGAFHAGFLVELATAVADQFAGEGALVEADRELIAEAASMAFATASAA